LKVKIAGVESNLAFGNCQHPGLIQFAEFLARLLFLLFLHYAGQVFLLSGILINRIFFKNSSLFNPLNPEFMLAKFYPCLFVCLFLSLSFNQVVAQSQVINGDLYVQGSECVGVDCPSSLTFGFSTLLFMENNLRIKFDDTSSSGSFPANDWEIEINESANGGKNWFAVRDATGLTRPFTVEAGSADNALYLDNNGDLGLGTDNPATDIELKRGDTPTIRLQQDGSAGFTSQSWDMAGNETNFFIRDVTNGSSLPFKIKPNAPDNSIVINTGGNVGVGILSPAEKLHVAGNVRANGLAPGGNVLANSDGVLYVDGTANSATNIFPYTGYAGIATTSPDFALTVLGTDWNSSQIRLATAAGTPSPSGTDNYTPQFRFEKSRGTHLVPVKLEKDDRVGAFLAGGHDGNIIQRSAVFGFRVDKATGTGNMPIAFFVQTGTSNSNKPERFLVKSNGKVQIYDLGLNMGNRVVIANDNGTLSTVPFDTFCGCTPPALRLEMDQQQSIIDAQAQQIESQEARINKLESLVEQLVSANGSSLDMTLTQAGSQEAWLGQNVPNPFGQSTRIDLYLPAEVSDAKLEIRDLSGRLVKTEIIAKRAKVSISLEVSELASGAYTYSLLADGKLVGTKKMVVSGD
jgi:hypothetical protein